MKNVILFLMLNIFFFTNSCFWIQPRDAQSVQFNKNVIAQSILLTALKNRFGRCVTEKKPLRFATLCHEECQLFSEAIDNHKKITTDFSLNQLMILLTVADKLKSPNLYALLIKTVLPHELDQQIAHIVFSRNTLQNSFIKKNDHTFQLCSFDHQPQITTQFNHKGDHYLTYIKLTTTRGNHMHACSLRTTSTQQLIKEFNDYAITQFSPTSNHIIVAKSGIQRHSSAPLILYNIDLHKAVTLHDEHELSSYAFSPDGRYLALALVTADNEHILQLWDIRDFHNRIHQQFTQHVKNITALAFDDNNTYLITGSNEINKGVILWNITDFNAIVPHILFTEQHDTFTQFTFSSDNTTVLATMHKYHHILFSLLNKNKPIPLHITTEKAPQPWIATENAFPYNQKIVYSLNPFSHTLNYQAHQYATFCDNKVIELYTITNPNNIMCKKIQHVHRYPIKSMQFSNNGLLLSQSPDQIHVWDAMGKNIQTINRHDNHTITSATINSRGTHILATSTDIKSVVPQIASKQTHYTLYTLLNAPTDTTLTDIDTALTTQRALLLTTLCTAQSHKKSTDNQDYIIEKDSLDATICASFTQSQQQLLQKHFSIQHT